MLGQLRSAALLLLMFTFVTGLVYPLTMTALAQLMFPAQANGSLVRRDGRAIGSALIGQPFHAQGYFWSRPSATSPTAYNAAASSGSNLGPSHPALGAAVRERVAALRESGADDVPVDLVASSGSGLDPHISPAAALHQVRRVAQARGLPVAQLETLVRSHTEPRTLGVLGEPRVNVLRLNLALDRLASHGS